MKCLFWKSTSKMVTLVQEPNPRAVLMLLVWMRFLSCTFPHATSTPEHQPAVYFRCRHTDVPDTWVICAVFWRKRDLTPASEVCCLDSFPIQWDICVQTLLLEVADMDVLSAVSSCSWAPSFCEEKHLSHVSLLWKKRVMNTDWFDILE